MTIQQHIDADPEDIEDVFKKIEESYQIHFEANELSNVRTFGELCDHIIHKIKQQDADDCTSQQAFYKLRDAIVVTKQLDKSSIQTDTTLSSIFPRHHRRRQIADIENILGFKLKILRPKDFIIWTLVAFFIISLVGLYFNWKFGLAGLVASILLSRLADITGKEFDENTVGEVANKMIQENYFRSRRNSATVNKNEVVKKMEQLFVRDLVLEKAQITPDTIIVGRN